MQGTGAAEGSRINDGNIPSGLPALVSYGRASRAGSDHDEIKLFLHKTSDSSLFLW